MQDRTISAALNKVLNTSPVSSAGVNGGAQMLTVVTGPATGSGSTGGDASGAQANAAQSALTDAIAQSSAQLAQVQSSIQSQLDSLTANTQALGENTSSKSAGSVAAGAAGSLANTILGGGLLGSIVSGLTSLFGGGDSQTSASPVKFALPQAIQLQAGTDGSTTGGISYGQNDVPRVNAPAAAGSSQITVNVSALDSQSFLDHSADIASAVRKAMLESSSLNDVISEM